MTDGMDDANIQARYAAQFAADLENNEKEQESLRARLEQLAEEHVWLSGMRGTVAGEKDAPGDAAGSADGAASAAAAGNVPRPRRAKKAADAPGRRKKPAQAKSAETPKAAEGRTRKSDGPTLGELVLGLLTQHHQPRMVSEVVNELGQAHPERTVSAQVVRNTVEALVAKGRLDRERKQGSVFYTAPTGTASETVPTSPVSEPAATAEKATAEV
ncbi:hypothetical protein [Streptomyces olivoreticuli]|uniref:hypothetical protein n=1 Tax=Streptomyces olivoreticuli TaxID=68246 RepID=UPI0013C304F6|nr:hypothetical protein [Streptomyces olivoreticuli]